MSKIITVWGESGLREIHVLLQPGESAHGPEDRYRTGGRAGCPLKGISLHHGGVQACGFHHPGLQLQHAELFYAHRH